jgi:type II secretory pathway component PulM
MSALTDTVTKVRARAQDLARRLTARPVGYFTAEWERLAPRTRRLVAILAIAIVSMSTLVGTYLLFDGLDDLQEHNADVRKALAAIALHRDEYLEARARSATQEARIGTEPPQLTADIEAAARDESIQIAESSERPTSPAGPRYVEHDVDIKIREVDLQSLTKFLRHLETQPRLVFFTRLAIKKRFSDDKLDVEATATAFERVREDKTKKKPGASDDKGGTP